MVSLPTPIFFLYRIIRQTKKGNDWPQPEWRVDNFSVTKVFFSSTQHVVSANQIKTVVLEDIIYPPNIIPAPSPGTREWDYNRLAAFCFFPSGKNFTSKYFSHYSHIYYRHKTIFSLTEKWSFWANKKDGPKTLVRFGEQSCLVFIGLCRKGFLQFEY